MKVVAVYRSSEIIPFAIFYCNDFKQTNDNLEIMCITIKDSNIIIIVYNYSIIFIIRSV